MSNESDPPPGTTHRMVDANHATSIAKVRAQQVPVAVQVIDRLGELAAVLAGAVLCHSGKISGMEWMVFSGAVLGVQNGFRTLGGRAVGPAGAAVLLLLPLGTLADRLAMLSVRTLLPLLGVLVLLTHGG